MFRRLASRLSDRFRCIAPDLPGFGHTQSPPAGEFAYTFERLAEVVSKLLERLRVERCALYVFDFGAPVGFRIAATKPSGSRRWSSL